MMITEVFSKVEGGWPRSAEEEGGLGLDREDKKDDTHSNSFKLI